ncbi:hypothetical protein E2C01_063459 [Portunus trituberculatus]|uniref:Uncharacterized protein n=1 Tax=Portunus trituberculatus TaxID=210409 RepID=A0A5B7HGF0_PORTR|nr:hypothetical protein [Portunus trituberculatus]
MRREDAERFPRARPRRPHKVARPPCVWLREGGEGEGEERNGKGGVEVRGEGMEDGKGGEGRGGGSLYSPATSSTASGRR